MEKEPANLHIRCGSRAFNLNTADMSDAPFTGNYCDCTHRIWSVYADVLKLGGNVYENCCGKKPKILIRNSALYFQDQKRTGLSVHISRQHSVVLNCRVLFFYSASYTYSTSTTSTKAIDMINRRHKIWTRS